MKKALFLVFLLALPAIALPAGPAFADEPVREAFPSDYTPSPCAADTAAVCQSFAKDRMNDFGATFRKFDLSQEWVNAHWEEMTKVFEPLCTKIANCFTVKDNDWIFCVDLMREDFLATCNRFPAGSTDDKECRMFALTYFIGLGAKTQLHNASQECLKGQTPGATRKLVGWMEPATYTLDFDDNMTVYTYDAETHIPVRARMTIDGGSLKILEGPDATAGYAAKWRAGLKKVTNADGHRDLVTPTVTLEATGYETLVLPIRIETPRAVVAMTPPATQWKTGANTITITARDATTGKDVEMRVMAGDRVLGKTNRPLQLNLEKGQKRPEIWVTSLFERYSDQVLAKAQ